jgi:hypothetical protein
MIARDREIETSTAEKEPDAFNFPITCDRQITD